MGGGEVGGGELEDAAGGSKLEAVSGGDGRDAAIEGGELEGETRRVL